jgi:hypothetical protein
MNEREHDELMHITLQKCIGFESLGNYREAIEVIENFLEMNKELSFNNSIKLIDKIIGIYNKMEQSEELTQEDKYNRRIILATRENKEKFERKK